MEIGGSKLKAKTVGKSGRYCAVINCSSSDYGLKKWSNSNCQKHHCLHGSDNCNCRQPYHLHNFPTKLKKPAERSKWVQLLNRVTPSNKPWSPKKSSRVCSKHFVDSLPTEENPLPTENLGYNAKRKVENLTSIYANPRLKKKAKRSPCQLSVNPQNVHHDHSYTSVNNSSSVIHHPVKAIMDEHRDSNSVENGTVNLLIEVIMLLYGFVCGSNVVNFLYVVLSSCRQKLNVILILRAQVLSLRDENDRLKKRVVCLQKKHDSCRCKLSLFDQLIKNDDDVNFYSGIPTITTFKHLQEFIAPYVRHLWRGAKHTSTKIKRKFRSTPNCFGPQRKLCGLDQFFLMWMKLRLNTPMRDLANRFNISKSTCSRIFSSWTRASSIILKSLLFIPDQGTINATKPPRFFSIRNLNMIIDCSELFIQTPKNHLLQRLSWSSYKHHNTLKFLVGISPNSMITFISKAFCGSISDKEICLQSGLFNVLEPYCCIMADKGFKISQECTAHRIQLIIPPGRRGQAKMLSDQVLKTKEIAQLRILVEQVIRRLKCYRMLSQELPLNLISHIDDILVICSAVVNMKEPIMK